MEIIFLDVGFGLFHFRHQYPCHNVDGDGKNIYSDERNIVDCSCNDTNYFDSISNMNGYGSANDNCFDNDNSLFDGNDYV